jgi:hypothetical protein
MGHKPSKRADAPVVLAVRRGAADDTTYKGPAATLFGKTTCRFLMLISQLGDGVGK